MSPVLILIDTQQGFCNEHIRPALPNLGKLLSTWPKDRLLATVFKNSENSLFQRELNWNEMMGPPETDVISELQIHLDGRSSFVKQTYSPDFLPAFQKQLELLMPSEIHLAGFDTDGCILATAFSMFDRGYRVRIHADACASSGGPHYHKCALEIMVRNFGKACLINS